VVRGVIGLDGGSTSSKAVLVDERARSSARPTSSPRATRSKTPRSCSPSSASYVKDQGATLEVLGFGATGYAADVLQECVKRRRQHRRDRRPHDERGEVLRRRRRHLRHRRAGHQGPVHEERRHRQLQPVELVLGGQRHVAPGHGRPVRPQGHRLRRHGLPGRAGAEVQLRLRGLPRHRPGQLPEGGLLQGGAARGPRPGAAEERLAVRRADPAARLARHALRAPGRHAVQPRRRQGPGRLHQGARAQRGGVRAPAHGRGRRARRGLRDAARGEAPGKHLHRHRGGDQPRVRDQERRETVCHFCPNECKRTFIDTKRPDGRPARYISGFSCEKGTVESEEAMLALVAERKKTAKEFPEPRRLRGAKLFSALLQAERRCPRRARPSRTWC
jgi:hypothetical protein